MGYLLLAALAAIATGGVASAQPAAPSLLANLAGEAKLLRAAEILAPFQAGDTQSNVIVTLRPSAAADALSAQSRSVQVPPEFTAPGAPPFYNLQDRKLRRELRMTVGETVAAAAARLAGDGLEITRQFSYQFGFAARVTPGALRRLVDDPEVVTVEQDHVLQPHLAQGIPLMGAAAPRAGHDGSGMSIAICDTGIDTSHPRLGNGGSPVFNAKVIGGYDTGDNDADPRPDPSFGEAHGTACAGIAAGDLGTVGDYIGGVAPGAKLYAIKISTGTGGSATDSSMVAGWEWAITHQDDDPNNPILVISTSFGGGGASAACDADVPAMTTAAANAVAAGITLFASSGNDGYCNMVAWPACISHVNSVGAVYDANIGSNVGWCVNSASCAPKEANGGCSTGWAAFDATTAADRVTVYSNSASFLTLFAPSNNAYTADIVGAGGYDAGDYDTTFGGTSAACPYAAGAAAVLQSAAKDILGAYLTPAQVKQYLVNNGDNVTDLKVAVTKPRVDLERAVNALGFPLSVKRVGRGTVSSTPAGINCGSDCSHEYTPGTPVTLTAAEYPGVPFLGWSGEGCSGTGTCDVLMDRARTVTAAFASFPWTMFLPGITTNSGPPPAPATYWSAFSYVYCPTSEATFSLTSAGVTKNSVMPAGGNSGRGGTFEGWVKTAPGSNSFTWRLATATCGTWNGNFSYALLDGKNYMFYLDLNASNQPVVYVFVNNGDPTAVQGSAAPEIGNPGAQANSGMRLIEQIPLDIPAGIFKRAQTAR